MYDFLENQDGFFSHQICGVMSQFEHWVDDSAGDSVVHDVTQSCQTNHNLVNVTAVQVFKNGWDQHDQQVRVFVEEDRTHQVPNSF